MVNDQAIVVKRLMYTQFQKFVWAYSVEEIMLKFDDRMMEMKTEFIQKSTFFPPVGSSETELIKYQAFEDLKTKYSKNIQIGGGNLLKKYVDKFSDSFKKGCNIVEDRCSTILE